ncbi:hypothetical protein [Paractinoplanes atraurantiacus]|uniref:Uncharacterized protein n=1 Tax=Paractinoplanes atraurantiacus TaxID=1036182 RepID=A0A285HMV4_9ACTN|nr:hypothetical protein [Actinoplanes atraurantiacus]SNY36994.1 hypothetical protein SAMN05421748_10523 [Actinoplanes atraurantiacus]
MDDGWYRLAMILTLFIGIWQGPIAIIFRVFTDKEPSWLVAANYLPAPWCYIVAVAAGAFAFVVIAVLETRRKRAVAQTSA